MKGSPFKDRSWFCLAILGQWASDAIRTERVLAAPRWPGRGGLVAGSEPPPSLVFSSSLR